MNHSSLGSGLLWLTIAVQCLSDLALGQVKPVDDALVPFHLVDATKESEVDFVHFNGRTGKFFIVETVSSGLAIFDYDGDGWLDLYFLNGAPLPGHEPQAAGGPLPPTNRLYRNLGNGKFADVTTLSGTGDLGHGMGVVAGDIDNDGDPDLYLSNFGPKRLLINQGDGTFLASDSPILADDSRVGAGTVLLDIDNDSDLDLFVANYLKFDITKKIVRKIFGVQASAGPLDYPPETNALFRNEGDGQFNDISLISGIVSQARTGMGAISLDYDGDGDADIFVCNDTMTNSLYENLGGGRFSDEAILLGVATNYAGAIMASMGVDCGDFDNDGQLDLLVTNFENEVPVLYRNSGKGFFDDVGVAAGLGVANRTVKWGVILSDFDNDSLLDAFIACGHLIDTAGQLDDTTHFAAKNIILQGTRDRKFRDVSALSGSGMQVREVSRGAGADDLDNDGDLDLVVLNANAAPTLIRNDSARRGHWIQLSLVGRICNRDAVGAKVRVRFGDQSRVAQVHAGRGYQSHYGSRLHFGLGNHQGPVQVDVQWPDGSQQTFDALPADRRHQLIQHH